MGDSTRICSYCRTPNKGAHRYCVRCSAPLDVYGVPTRPVAAGRTRGRSAAARYVLAAGLVLALAAGFMIHQVVRATHEVPTLTEDVHADNAPAVVTPPPAVSGWVPGGSAPAVEPDTAPAWSPSSFPVARPNPYDVPGDPSTSMVGIAPHAPRERAALARKHAFTNDDLLATRGSVWSTPSSAPAPAPAADAEASEEIAKRETKLREKLARVSEAERRLSEAGADHRDDAADALEDARHDAAKAELKLEEARRRSN